MDQAPSIITLSDWGDSITGDPGPVVDFPLIATSSDKPSSSESTSRGTRRPTAEAIARRRKQNRVSQAAWRARNKELVEELRQEISDYAEHTERMQQTMESLLQQTETLKAAIETALALKPPGKDLGSAQQTTQRGPQLMSPTSSNEGPSQDLDCGGETV